MNASATESMVSAGEIPAPGEPGPRPGGRSRIPWRKRLGVRITVAVGLIMLATLSVVALLTIRQQRDHSFEELLKDAHFFADTIRSTTHDQMLANRKDETYRVMERIGRQRGVERVRVFNRTGKVTFSTDRSEIGRIARLYEEPCIGCHRQGRPAPSRDANPPARIYTAPDGSRMLGMIMPVSNEPACARPGCHLGAAKNQVLGVIEVALSAREEDAALLRQARHTGLLAACALVVTSALVFAHARRFILAPVRDLLAGTMRVAGGEFRREIPVRSEDELGRLAQSFNEMRDALVRMHQERQQLLEGLEKQVEQRTAELEATQANLVQTEKLASLGRLSASIAHEINNPLAGILTFSKVLQANLEDPDAADMRAASVRQAKLIQRETERCRTIVRNLLDFARERPMDVRELDVNGPLQEALSLSQHKFEMQGIAVEKTLQVPLTVLGDFGQLRQAFLNIVLNACDAMPGGGTLQLRSRALPGGRYVEVAVIDSGVGMPPEVLAKVFDPFFTTKEMGTGLGLSVVYGVVEKHRGRVFVDSTPGSGTTMRLVLPAAPPDHGP